MAKPDLGTKRLCGSCGAKFYDLAKDPIICPKCETVFHPVVYTSTRMRPEAARAPVAPLVPEAAEAPEVADVELVSLEDADAERAAARSSRRRATSTPRRTMSRSPTTAPRTIPSWRPTRTRATTSPTSSAATARTRRTLERGALLWSQDGLRSKLSRESHYRRGFPDIAPPERGHSSVGRALEWHSRGQGLTPLGSTSLNY